MASISPTPDGSFSLSLNVFSPSNGSLDVQYAVVSSGHVKVRVINVLGEVVRNLVDQSQGVGPQQIAWDGRNGSGAIVGSGLYWIRIETSDAVKMLKVLVRR
jgi:flagellar hook assembly protein FlgD